MKNRTEIVDRIINYFKANEDEFARAIEELDDYNGYLNDNRCYPMEMLDEFLCGSKPTEIIQLAFFGHDDDNWTTNQYGEKRYGEFNPNSDYFYFNGYGNLVSTRYPDYSCYLDHYAIDEMEEHRCYVSTIDDTEELAELFDELENWEEEDEEEKED